MRLIDDWRALFLQLWSIRLALLLAALSGLYAAWPAFQDVLPPIPFAIVSMVLSMVIVGARITKQKGLDE